MDSLLCTFILTCDEHLHVHAVVDQLGQAELAEHAHVLLALRRHQKSLNAQLLVLLGQILKKTSLFHQQGFAMVASSVGRIQLNMACICMKQVHDLPGLSK